MMAFDPDLPRILPRKILRGVKLPPVTPTAPCGKFSSRALARAALLSALLREGNWFGEPMLRTWAGHRQFDTAQARELVAELVAAGRVEEAWSGSCPRWRAKGGA